MIGTTDSVIPAKYQITPMNGITDLQTKELKRTLASEHTLVTDPKRARFYEVRSPDNWFYIHVRESKVYLVWHAGRKAIGERGGGEIYRRSEFSPRHLDKAAFRVSTSSLVFVVPDPEKRHFLPILAAS